MTGPYNSTNIIIMSLLSSTLDESIEVNKSYYKRMHLIINYQQLHSSLLEQDMILASLLMRHTPMFHDPEVLKEAELTKEKYGSIPRVYIMCSQDLSMKADVQRWMIEKNPPQDVKVILGSDHMVMFSKTQEFCSRLMEIAEKYH